LAVSRVVGLYNINYFNYFIITFCFGRLRLHFLVDPLRIIPSFASTSRGGLWFPFLSTRLLADILVNQQRRRLMSGSRHNTYEYSTHFNPFALRAIKGR